MSSPRCTASPFCDGRPRPWVHWRADRIDTMGELVSDAVQAVRAWIGRELPRDGGTPAVFRLYS